MESEKMFSLFPLCGSEDSSALCRTVVLVWNFVTLKIIHCGGSLSLDLAHKVQWALSRMSFSSVPKCFWLLTLWSMNHLSTTSRPKSWILLWIMPYIVTTRYQNISSTAWQHHLLKSIVVEPLSEVEVEDLSNRFFCQAFPANSYYTFWSTCSL